VNGTLAGTLAGTVAGNGIRNLGGVNRPTSEVSMAIPPLPLADPFAQLDREWARLSSRRRHAATVRRWAMQASALADVTGLADFVVEDRSRRCRYFGAVVELVRRDDDLARRVMVQMLVPGLVCMTSELATMFGGVHREDLASDVVTAAWDQAFALSTGRSSARTPGCILRNIRRDTIRWHRSLRPRGAGLEGVSGVRPGRGDDETTGAGLVVPRMPHGRANEVEAMFDECETRLVLAGAVRNGVVDKRLADLIWRVVAEDRQFKQAASDVGLSEPWAYQLRARTTPALRAHLDAAA
jgi:hypothetical protein